MALHKTKHWLTLLLACGSMALTACEPLSSTETTDPGEEGVTTVSVTLSTATLISGTRATATASVRNSETGAVSGASVCFDAGTLAQAVGAECVTTDGNGTASTQIEAGAVSGSSTLKATLSGSATSASANYEVDGPVLTMGSTPLIIANGTTATATATIRDGAGNPVVGAVVSFALGDATLAVMAPSSGTVLTDASGNASVVLSPGSDIGASTITAQATVNVLSTTTSQSVGTANLTAQVNFESRDQIETSTVKLSPLALGTSTLSAYGTTSVTVNVLDSNNNPYTTPVAVRFGSACVGQNKAKIDAEVLSINGVATASFVDEGCGGTDTIQASLVGITSSSVSAPITIAAPTVGSIKFESALPVNISLKGTGGVGRQETSTVTFKVVDEANKPKSAEVTFGLSTTIGGITLSRTTATSDANGLVSTVVQAGTISTPVRVTATVEGENGTLLKTQSDQLTISTGLPDQAHFSISADKLNIEGWSRDGEVSKIFVRMADHFGNPVPEGTAVTFTAEGGKIESNCVVNQLGECDVDFISQSPRPSNGRITILAYAIGEETFTDKDGDGYATLASERVDLEGRSTDMGEAFVDINANGVYDNGEPYRDFNSNGIYDGPDGKLNSTLCEGAICSASPTLHVRSQLQGAAPFQLVLADSYARVVDMTVNGAPYNLDAPTPIDLGGCSIAPVDINFRVVSEGTADVYKNPMPVGTKVEVKAEDNGAMVGNSSFTVGNTLEAGLYSVRVKADGTVSGDACTDTKKVGFLNITVTTPLGNATIYRFDLRN